MQQMRFSVKQNVFSDMSVMYRRLLNYACQAQIPLPTAETLLNSEITWLKKVRVSCFIICVATSAVIKTLHLAASVRILC